MIVIIGAKYKKNTSRAIDPTEQTRFSKSRQSDLEDIGQGQGSSHETHPLMLLIICTKFGKNPSWTVDATGWTRKVNEQTDRQTDRVNPIYPPHPPRPTPLRCGGYNYVALKYESTRNTKCNLRIKCQPRNSLTYFKLFFAAKYCECLYIFILKEFQLLCVWISY